MNFYIKIYVIFYHCMYTAIIVEPRKHRALEFVLKNFAENLDDRWDFVIYHGTENDDYISDIISRNECIRNHTIKLVNLGVENMKPSDYSKLFYEPSFYDHISSETFLVFQTDTLINREYNHKIYEFIKYDYVGSPWRGIEDKNGFTVGNGGLSLRKKSKMLEMIERYGDLCLRDNTTNKHFGCEDRFFSNTCDVHLEGLELFKPSWQVAANFSIETIIYTPNPFGIHKAYQWLKNHPRYQELRECIEGMDELERLNTN